MATNQTMYYCKRCARWTPHIQPATSHVLHLLLCLLTCGLWLGVWAVIVMVNFLRKTCTVCGRLVGLTG
jgi:hypothetical protein